MARKGKKRKTTTRKKASRKISKKKRAWISRKIRLLRHEGYPQRQAIAIAYSMAGVARKQKRKRKHGKEKRAKKSTKRKQKHKGRVLLAKPKGVSQTAYSKWVREYNAELERRYPGYRYTV